MCNPRRVRVTATREIAEEWRRSVERSVSLGGWARGEARVRRPLGQMGAPVLAALQMLLDRGAEGWNETERGFRLEIEGGYLIYDIDAQELEIVAVLEDEVQATGSAGTELRGQVRERLETEQEGRYWDDGYGGRTEEVARREAEQAAQRELDRSTAQHLADAADQAEAAEAERLQTAAREDAERQLAVQQAARDAELAEAARARLDAVGLRALRAFNGLLAEAYRDAILAYARSRGADGIRCDDNNGTLEIEFRIDA